MWKLIFISLFSSVTFANEIVTKSTVEITGVVVSSSCSISVTGGHVKSGVVDFGTYYKGKSGKSQIAPFSLELYEDGSHTRGCSAFLAGESLVKLTFGDSGNEQLDQRGVVTNGAGNGVRIEISATDKEASNRDTINIDNNVLHYPQSFATKGLFSFTATPVGLEEATAGQFNGKLSVTITYK